MSTINQSPSPAPVPPVRAETRAEKLERLAAEQGVSETATYEYQLGAGVGLWDSDEDFEDFIRLLARIRAEGQ